jgi:hypothetical protein
VTLWCEKACPLPPCTDGYFIFSTSFCPIRLILVFDVVIFANQLDQFGEGHGNDGNSTVVAPNDSVMGFQLAVDHLADGFLPAFAGEFPLPEIAGKGEVRSPAHHRANTATKMH